MPPGLINCPSWCSHAQQRWQGCWLCSPPHPNSRFRKRSLLRADAPYSESSTGQQLLQAVVDEPGVLGVAAGAAADVAPDGRYHPKLGVGHMGNFDVALLQTQVLLVLLIISLLQIHCTVLPFWSG